ncbi:unnamed protein product [Paramecium sonneborni]|uniref:Transmembrane protein n=1 Tax=Paramecium sonneborni TaxID=65129 RepID=A0A8S1KQ76_9CILI|nr:unnamed protein product [Paramecium sonneborni]
MQKIKSYISKLLNDDHVCFDQSYQFILFVRMFQFLQYLAITLQEINDNEKQVDGHFSIFFQILKLSILDINFLPDYIGFITTFFNIAVLVLFILQIVYFKRTLIILMRGLIGYLAQLPQIMCFLFVSSSFRSFILKEDTNIIIYIWAICDVTLIFSLSLISCILFKNISFNQSTYTRDQSLMKIISQIFQFITQILYFYDDREEILILKQLSALLWIGLEQIDIYLYMPYSLYDSKLIFTLNQIKFGCNLINLILNNLSDIIETTFSQYIYYFIFSSMCFYLGETFYQRLFYAKGLDTFTKSSQKDQHLQIKVLRQFQIQAQFTLSQTEKLLQIGMVNQHIIHCNRQCRSQDSSDVITCIINYQVSNKEEENLFLFKIQYLAFQNKQYSQSLARIKHYQIKYKQELSWYFNLVQIEISNKLRQEITKQQFQKILESNSTYVNFTSDDLVHLDVQSDILIPIIRKTLSAKLDVWKKLLKGFSSVKQLQLELVKLAQELEQLRIKFKLIINRDVYEVNISQVNNLYHLRMLSLYYSIIMNDQLHSFLCEKQYYLIYSYEQTLQQDQLNSIALVLDKVSIVTVSLVQSLGSILNTNKQQLGHMFNYKKSEEFQNINHLNQLMPDFMAQFHNQMLSNFLIKGDSPFMHQFRLIFGKAKDNFIFPLYLKLANDFSYQDDYVIKGIFFSGVKKYDYLLFDSNGRILGITRQIYYDLFADNNNNHEKIELSLLYDQCFLYYFMPDLFDIVKRFQQRQKDSADNIIFSEDTIFVSYNEIQEFHDMFQQQMRFIVKDFNSMMGYKKKQSLQIRQSTIQNQKDLNSQILELNLLNDNYAKAVKEFINQNVTSQKTCFVRFTLQFQKYQNDGYYIMQISDYRKHNFGELATELYALQDADSTMKKSTLRHLKDLIISKRRYGDLQAYQNIHKKRQMYQRQLVSINQTEILMTHQFSSAFQTPKTCFFKPEIALNSEMESVQEIRNSSSEESKFLDEFLSDDESKKQGQKIEKKIQSFSKTNNFTENEQNPNQSQNSSAISKASNNQSYFFQIVFKQKGQLPRNIIILWIIVYCINLISLVGFGFSNYHLISNYQQQQLQSEQFMGPIKFNRYFCKTLALSWTFILTKYNILNNSQFLNQQNQYQFKLLDQFVFSNLSQLYPVFIQMEQDGTISNMTLKYSINNSEMVEFTRLLNFLEEVIHYLVQIGYFESDNFVNFINQEYIEKAFIIKYNLPEIININYNLMNQLNENSIKAQEFESTIFITEHLVHTVMIFFIMMIQLFQWNNIEQQNRNLALLVGRIKEYEVENEIQRAYNIYIALNIQAGEDSWKRYNYYNYGFQQDTSIYQPKQKLSISQKLQFGSQMQKSVRNFNTKINLFSHLMKILVFVLIYQAYLWGGYQLQNSQNNRLQPLNNLLVEFALFSTKLDNLASCAIIIKTQFLIEEKLIKEGLYKQKQLEDRQEIIQLFSNIYDEIAVSFAQLYEQIIKDLQLDNQMEEAQGLLHSDICLYLSSLLPFCDLKQKQNYQEFIKKYGQYYAQDDNSEYFAQGILSLVTQMQQFYKQNYVIQIQLEQQELNSTELLDFLNSQEFNVIILSHFRDTYQCFVRFLELLEDNIFLMRRKNLSSILIYYNTIIIIYLIVFLLYYSHWIGNNTKVMRNIKLALIAIPHFQLTSDPIINILKRYQ